MWSSSTSFLFSHTKKNEQNCLILKQGKWEMTDFRLSTMRFHINLNTSHAEQWSCCAYKKIKTIRVEVGMPNVAGE